MRFGQGNIKTFLKIKVRVWFFCLFEYGDYFVVKIIYMCFEKLKLKVNVNFAPCAKIVFLELAE